MKSWRCCQCKLWWAKACPYGKNPNTKPNNGGTDPACQEYFDGGSAYDHN